MARPHTQAHHSFWQPSLLVQFLLGMTIVLVPLALVVIVFLQTLEQHMQATQQLVLQHYQRNERFSELKQLLRDTERATRQNWVLKSADLQVLLREQWQKSAALLQQQIVETAAQNGRDRWQALQAISHSTQLQVSQHQGQNAALFNPLRRALQEHGKWLHQDTQQSMQQNQQSLAKLQTSFIHWLLALTPLVLVIGGGFLWRVSNNLGYLSRTISRLGQGDWEQNIRLTGAAELRELGEQLVWMQQQLQRLEQQKDTFLRHVTHELKTPLASMVEGCELLSDEVVGEVNPAQRDVLDLIITSTERLSTMINSLLSYNAIRARKNTAQHTELSQLKDKITRHFAQRLALSAQHFNWQHSTSLQSLPIDNELLEMMLIQLLSNAIKFSPANSEITIEIEHTKSHCVIKVIDAGEGIDSTEKAQLFDTFYQGKAGRQCTEKGSGLGLSIVQECVQQLKGSISVYSVKPKGSCFRLEFT